MLGQCALQLNIVWHAVPMGVQVRCAGESCDQPEVCIPEVGLGPELLVGTLEVAVFLASTRALELLPLGSTPDAPDDPDACNAPDAPNPPTPSL